MSATGHDKALVAIGALDGRLAGHPLEPAWACRRRISSAIHAAALDGLKVDPDRLGRLIAGLPLERHLDGGAESSALAIHAVLSDPTEPVGAFLPHVREVTFRGVCKAAVSASEAGLSRSSAHAAFPFVLHRLGLTERVLVGVSPLGSADPFDVLTTTAVQGRQALDVLSMSWDIWIARLGDRRSTSRHLEALTVVASMGTASPAVVARILGMTERGAAFLLAELADLGVLREVTGRRGSWKVFVCIDHAIGAGEGGVPSRPRAKVPDLSSLFADVDRAIASVTRKLGTSNVTD